MSRGDDMISEARSLEGVLRLQDESLRSFRTTFPEIWSAFLALDRTFSLATPADQTVDTRTLPILLLTDECWRAFMNAAAAAARSQPSEPFMFCRRGCEAALYAARITSFRFGTPEYETAARAWSNRREDRSGFDRYFKAKDNYKNLGDIAARLYAFRSEFSELGPHASAQAAELHLLPTEDSVATTPFATSMTGVRDGALNVVVVFHWVVEALLGSLAGVGFSIEGATNQLASVKLALPRLLQETPREKPAEA